MTDLVGHVYSLKTVLKTYTLNGKKSDNCKQLTFNHCDVIVDDDNVTKVKC